MSDDRKNSRIAVVFNNEPKRLEAAAKLARSLKETSLFESVKLFTKSSDASFEDLAIEVIPDSCDTLAKARNFVNSFFKDHGFKDFLHVLDDRAVLENDPRAFLEALEKMIDVLDYDVWLNTICDPCNYVYSKFNPRLSIAIDREDVKSLGLSEKIFFTSNSNLAWTCYNFAKVSDDLLKFNEGFNIPMFMIIEFLARRRNTKRDDQVYFMNMYATIPEELKVFKVEQTFHEESFKPEEMAAEDKVFKSLNVDFAPTNNIDEVLERFWNKVKSKLPNAESK